MSRLGRIFCEMHNKINKYGEREECDIVMETERKHNGEGERNTKRKKQTYRERERERVIARETYGFRTNRQNDCEPNVETDKLHTHARNRLPRPVLRPSRSASQSTMSIGRGRPGPRSRAFGDSASAFVGEGEGLTAAIPMNLVM